MSINAEGLTPEMRLQAGHYEVLGETYAAFELFEHGWNPYSRFLDVDKVDFILRKLHASKPIYREAQVKFGKLYSVGSKWEKALFDVTSWRLFKPDEFSAYDDRKDFFLIYVLSAGTGTDREIFVFPIKEFNRLIDLAITRGSKKGGTKKAMYISRSKADTGRWFMRKVGGKMERITEENCIEVSRFRRAFHLLDLADTKGKVRSS
ncbi:hypothetical protein [Haloferula sargassicola]|uniref:Uncharacterized protein n=1 Tax=Haloferula sargassicola TaxID=490096 RepID=A0ABP9URW0_9BACT